MLLPSSPGIDAGLYVDAQSSGHTTNQDDSRLGFGQ